MALATSDLRVSTAAASSNGGGGGVEVSSTTGAAATGAALGGATAVRDAKGAALILLAFSALDLTESVSNCGAKVSAPDSEVKGDFCLNFPADNFVPDVDLLGGPPKDAGLREISSVLSGKTEVFRVNFG